MLRCMDSAVAGLRAHQNKMDVVGNNIANVNTVGFKAQTYTFQDAMYQTSNASTAGNDTSGGTNAAQYGYGALMGSIGMDMTASTPFYASGLNAAINGEGFFLTSAGRPADGTTITTASFKDTGAVSWDYTRVGQFMVDSQGYLTDANGNFVYGFQPSTGYYKEKTDDKRFDLQKLVPLRVPTGVTDATPPVLTFDYTNNAKVSKNVSINSQGEVIASVQNDKGDLTAGIPLGKVALVTFQNPNGLTKAGGNYFKASKSDNTGDATASTVGAAGVDLMAGYLEASNVDLAQEFSDMVTTHRGYQANTKMITVADEMLADLVSMKR